jgi:signal transduction histidine kinase
MDEIVGEVRVERAAGERTLDLTDDRSTTERSALYRIASMGSSVADTDRVVRDILGVVRDEIRCRDAAIFLLDGDGEDMSVHTVAGRSNATLALTEPSVVRRIGHSSRGELVPDLRADADSMPVLPGLGAPLQMIAAPLVAGDQTLGVLAVFDSHRGSFTEEDLRLLERLADRASLTIENTQLVESLQQQVQELEGIHRLSRFLTSWDSVQHVVGESVRIVSDMLSCERMALLLYDENGHSMQPQAPAAGIEEEQLAVLTTPLSKPSLIATVFRTNTALLSNDARSDSWVGKTLRDRLHVQSMLVTPLAAGPKPIGVLVAINAKKGSFDDNDLRFAGLLAGRVASAIESSLARERERALVHSLKEADRTKSEFVSMLAHELNGPMTTIMGFGQSLNEGWDRVSEDKRREIIQIMARETQRLSRLVNDLLDVSRMEAGSLRYDLEPLSLGELVDGVLDVHTSLKADHLVTARVPHDLPRVVGDKDRLRQVLLNLLTNATRYSPGGTTIDVAAETVQFDGRREVRVSVSDHGIGIPVEDRDRVFSKFAMLPKPGWVKKGTGLGLFITKGIVEAHGGRLWIDAGRDEGTTFHFTLPIASSH